MPRITVRGASLHYEEHGAGPETVVLAHGLLWSGRLFDRQVEALAPRYRCVTFDFRGHGRSEVTADGYDMDSLAADAASLIEALGCAPCHFVGLSMGGFVGMRLAIRQPGLLRSLILLETSADPEPEASRRKYHWMNLAARWIGLGALAKPVMRIIFGRKFLGDPARAALREQCRRELASSDRTGIIHAVKGVIDRQGVYEQLEQIATPTLILVGDQDLATPPARSERIHARIAGSHLQLLPGAGHTSTIEEPAAVNAAIADFLAGLR
ncbi:MAG TPA: alpha/beta fold hydrolase [Thermoanaerobaculia bacterium]|nr:alpha/beta fold hydrolase [Thermoanaerobaculia bacterium]